MNKKVIASAKADNKMAQAIYKNMVSAYTLGLSPGALTQADYPRIQAHFSGLAALSFEAAQEFRLHREKWMKEVEELASQE